ncbi:xylulokinase [Pseudonocardia sp. HH130630-07]|uniref:xylulokinase n=1 Tax=Pseudonocardia sp. HH130630-07 TaxID=1690815 RepID=UPI0008151388|nr:FGGY-family carbohydrate kinase [Pseudonocardia sp. HH130630-07]ANY08444.1 hypothetical protein AFB00_21640 [Pseudonocardia sp. HH130630-07]
MGRPAGPVVAVDVGTSAVRAAVVAADGTVTGAARVSRAGGVGGEHFDAEQLWADVCEALGRAVATAGPVVPVALGIAGHIGSVALDADLRPVGPAGGWADTRGTDLVAGLPGPLLDRVRETSGRPVPGAGWLAHALHLQVRYPDRAARVRALVSPKDFLLARCVGEPVTDTVDAAYSLVFDVRRGRWDHALLAELGVGPGWWPRVVAPGAPVAGLLPGVAAVTGLPAGLPVVGGGPDGSVGVGLLLGDRTDLVADVAGTTDVLGRVHDSPAAAGPGALLNPGLRAGRWVSGGPTGLTGGAVLRWRELTGGTGHTTGRAADEAAVEALAPGADGLLVVPTMSGDRFPGWRPGTRGAVLGQTPGHGPAHLVRAAQEGAAFTVREGVELLDDGRAAGPRPVVLAGGAARSEAAARLRADVFGRRVLACADPDVTLLGAAALAMAGAGCDLDEAAGRLRPRLRVVEPDPARAARYDELYVEWLDARERLVPGTGG